MTHLDPKIIAAYKEISTGTLGHFLNEGFLSWEIKPLFRPIKLIGQALTVSSPPTDNSILSEALEKASLGDVLVIDRQGDRRHAPWGGILSLIAQQKGLAGVVIDGAATDWQEITELRFPVFCKNLSALTTRRQSLGGTVGKVITCGGVIVYSGDVVIADEDGIIVIPQDRAEEILHMAQPKEARAQRMQELLKEGKPLSEVRELVSR